MNNVYGPDSEAQNKTNKKREKKKKKKKKRKKKKEEKKKEKKGKKRRCLVLTTRLILNKTRRPHKTRKGSPWTELRSCVKVEVAVLGSRP